MNIISLGAGVQSSTMALMAARGELEMPDAAIFADTQAEPREVYEWLDELEELLPFPVHRVTAGNLGEDFLNALKSEGGRCGQPPFFVMDREKRVAMLWRKCTTDYKIRPIRRKLRELCGGQPVIQWIGISVDEAHRMKPSGVGYIMNVWPLIDKRMSRADCLAWMQKNGYRVPPKSACVFCPYISDARLRHIRDSSPVEFERLVEFDHKIREVQKGRLGGARLTGTLYVSRHCQPIDEIDLSAAKDRQMELFGNECEGMCGV